LGFQRAAETVVVKAVAISKGFQIFALSSPAFSAARSAWACESYGVYGTLQI